MILRIGSFHGKKQEALLSGQLMDRQPETFPVRSVQPRQAKKFGHPCHGPAWPGCIGPGSGLSLAWGRMLLGKPGARADPQRTYLAPVPLLAATISSTASVVCRPADTRTWLSHTPGWSHSTTPDSPSHKSPPPSNLPYLQVSGHGEQGDSGHQEQEAIEKDKGYRDKERAAVNHR